MKKNKTLKLNNRIILSQNTDESARAQTNYFNEDLISTYDLPLLPKMDQLKPYNTKIPGAGKQQSRFSRAARIKNDFESQRSIRQGSQTSFAEDPVIKKRQTRLRTIMESMDSSLTIQLQKTIDLSRLNISGNNFKSTSYKSVDVSQKLGKQKWYTNHQAARAVNNSTQYRNVPYNRLDSNIFQFSARKLNPNTTLALLHQMKSEFSTERASQLSNSMCDNVTRIDSAIAPIRIQISPKIMNNTKEEPPKFKNFYLAKIVHLQPNFRREPKHREMMVQTDMTPRKQDMTPRNQIGTRHYVDETDEISEALSDLNSPKPILIQITGSNQQDSKFKTKTIAHKQKITAIEEGDTCTVSSSDGVARCPHQDCTLGFDRTKVYDQDVNFRIPSRFTESRDADKITLFEKINKKDKEPVQKAEILKVFYQN